MSWWVGLHNDDGSEVVTGTLHTEGGTIQMGGSDTADLNVTYNYSKFYYAFLDLDQGLRWLDGKKASETVERLEKAIKELVDLPDENYWAETSGNAGHALAVLLKWAREYPDKIWYVH